MMTIIGLPLALLGAALCVTPAMSAKTPVSADDAAAWIRYTVPLPKSIDVAGKVTLARGSVAVVGPKQPDRVVGQAMTELQESVGGALVTQTAFTITLSMGGPDATPLKSLENSDQAYRIFPVGTGGKQLRLVAPSSRGLYYAAKTLQQLIRAKSTKNSVVIPILTVKDWPDMEERGLWGGDNYEHLRWLADRKMNLMEQISAAGVEKDGTPYARPQNGRMVMFTEGPKYAINPVPVSGHITGFTALNDEEVIKAHPIIRGKSKHPGVLCYSQPKSTEIISAWIYELAKLPNVTGVDQWLTENLHGETGCQCEACKATGVDPMVLEARAVIAAWRMAKKRLGRPIDLRVLTSEATEEFNRQIFSELPKGVKVVYYHSLLTYTCRRAHQLEKYLADWTKAGNWLAVCPNISTYPRVWIPFDSVQFVHYRLKEYNDKGCSGLLGYAVPRVNYYRFNVEAAAEYAWNAAGRSPREFAASWAVREGMRDPEKFADYAMAVGQVLWDCHGSDWPSRAHNWIDDPIDKRLADGTVPDLGYVKWGFITVPFGSIENEKRLNEDVELAEKAMKLANEMGSEEFVQEARVARGLIGSLKALYELRGMVRNGSVAPGDKHRATRYFQMYVDSLRETIDALPKWETRVRREEPERMYTPQEIKTIQEELIDRMIATAGKLGVTIR